jgi:RNA polymerase sigma factor (sigma-70 family)
MESKGTHPVLGFIRKIAAAGEIRQLTDEQLLKRYATERDEAAFASLVHRHGAVVWRVCRSVLHESHAAEDAFQATFLILVRKAGTIGRPQLLGNWLYGVASRVALRARKTMAQREAHERRAARMFAMTAVDTAAEQDLQPLLHEELQRLPTKYRSPMVLCYLEGRTNEEAARRLQWPVGTLKVRLMRGRQLLRTRLARRGLALPAAALTSTILSGNAASAVPAPLLDATIHAALSFAAGKAAGVGIISAHALALTEGVLKTMSWTKLKIVAAVFCAVGMLGAGLFTVRTTAADQNPEKDAVALGAPDPLAAPNEEAKMKAELKKLQGTWNMVALEIENAKMAANAFKGSKIVVKDDTFTTISMGANYKGTLKIDITSTPKTIDMMFTEGPEKGNTSLGIYELDGDTWKICLTLGGNKARPKEFVTKPGSSHALETLKRETGEDDQAVLNKESARLEGEWAMVSGEHDGQAVPEAFFKMWKRVARGNDTTVTFAGQTMLKATFTIDPSKNPKTIDYTVTDGSNKGKKQYGIYEWDGDKVRFCFAAPGKDRPTQFTTKGGDQITLSVWKRAEK